MARIVAIFLVDHRLCKVTVARICCWRSRTLAIQYESKRRRRCTYSFTRVAISATVREIFDGIFNVPMEQFKEPLEFIKENKFRAVWRDDAERHEKVMSYAKTFLKAVTANVLAEYAEAAKHIEGSTCDLRKHIKGGTTTIVCYAHPSSDCSSSKGKMRSTFLSLVFRGVVVQGDTIA